MSVARYLPLSSYQALKAATRQLVDLNGGGPRAAAVTRLGQPDLSRGGSVSDDNAERFIPLDVIADLEAAAGAPVVTRTLAELADCLLIPIPQGAPGDELAQEAGLSAQRFGQMMTDFGKAVVDGSMDRREDAAIISDIDQLLIALYRFRETVKAKAEATDGQ